MSGRRVGMWLVTTIAVAAAVSLSAVESRGPILLPHKVHTENQVDCAACHGDLKADRGLARMLPMKATCAPCHDVQSESECGMCHADAKKPRGYGKELRRTNFLHSQHTDLLGACDSCHGSMEGDRSAKIAHANCKDCHQEDLDGLLCAKCHRGFEGIGLKALTSFSHADGFLKEHKEYAKRSRLACAQCHQESFCFDCHNPREELRPEVKQPEKVFRHFVHRGDWLTVHPMEARADGSLCTRCHRPAECKECHARQGMDRQGDLRARRHPDGYVAVHGREARRNIQVCASCHDQGKNSTCLKCHGAGGFNPHPAGWKRQMDSENAIQHKDKRMCLTCHKERELCTKCHR